MKKLYSLLFITFLAGCGTNPVSYLPSGTTPIVNIESDINEQVAVKAETEQFNITNLSSHRLNLVYKIYWYDIDGVTQRANENWHNLQLEAQQIRRISLIKPTDESMNYRLYLRHYQ